MMISTKRRGVTAISYALLAGLIALVSVAAFAATGSTLSCTYKNVASGLTGGTVSACGSPAVVTSTTLGVAGVNPFISQDGFGVIPAGTICTNSATVSQSGTTSFTRSCVAPSGALYSASVISWQTASPSSVTINAYPGALVSGVTSSSVTTSNATYHSCLPTTTASVFYGPPGPARISPTEGVYNSAAGFVGGVAGLTQTDSVTMCTNS